jgi:hypothetical protein
VDEVLSATNRRCQRGEIFGAGRDGAFHRRAGWPGSGMYYS